MARLRIKEALEQHNEKNPKSPITLADIARYVFRDRETKDLHKRIRFYDLVSNKQKYIQIEWIKDICTITGVSPDFLIDFET